MEKNIILILLLAPLSVIICFYLKKYIFHKLEKSYLFVLPTIFYFLIFLLLLINQNDLNEVCDENQYMMSYAASLSTLIDQDQDTGN